MTDMIPERLLISGVHRRRYEEYYRDKYAEPVTNSRIPEILMLASRVNARSLLDYGCGKNSPVCLPIVGMLHTLYDPGVPEYSDLPKPADIVACLDVLEHCEPETVDVVIEHIMHLANKAVYLTISCQDSGESKLLPDGTKWHTFVKQHEWWEERLPEFECVSTDRKTYVGILIK